MQVYTHYLRGNIRQDLRCKLNSLIAFCSNLLRFLYVRSNNAFVKHFHCNTATVSYYVDKSNLRTTE